MLIIDSLPNYNMHVTMKKRRVVLPTNAEKPFAETSGTTLPTAINDICVKSYLELQSQIKSISMMSNEKLADMYSLASAYRNTNPLMFKIIDDISGKRGINYWYITSKNTDYQAPKFKNNTIEDISIDDKISVENKAYKYLQEMVIKEYTDAKKHSSDKIKIAPDFSSKGIVNAFELLDYIHNTPNCSQFDLSSSAFLSESENLERQIHEYKPMKSHELIDLFAQVHDKLENIKRAKIEPALCDGEHYSTKDTERMEYLDATLFEALKKYHGDKTIIRAK